MMIQHLETDCENVFRILKHLRKTSNLQKFAKMRPSGEESLFGTCYKTIADVNDGFGDRTPASREYTHPPADPYSKASAAIPGRTVIGPVIQVHIMQPLGSHGLEIQIQSQTNPDRKIPDKPSCISKIQDTISPYFRKEALQKSEPCSSEIDHSRI